MSTRLRARSLPRSLWRSSSSLGIHSRLFPHPMGATSSFHWPVRPNQAIHVGPLGPVLRWAGSPWSAGWVESLH